MSSESSSPATAGLRPVLSTLRALSEGDFGARVVLDAGPGDGASDPPHSDRSDVVALAESVNGLAGRIQHLAAELARVQLEVTRHGRLDERLNASPGPGAWADSVRAANTLLDALTHPVAEATRVLTAVAEGDPSQRIEQYDGHRPTRGELRRLGRTVNRVTSQLALFTSEVTRAGPEEDGEDGRRTAPHTSLRGLSGSWRAAAEAVNRMVSDLRETTRAKEWLESNLTRLAALMQGRRDIREVAELIMRELPPLVSAQYGALFLTGVNRGSDVSGGSDVTVGAADPAAASELTYVAGFGTSAFDTGTSLVPGMPAAGLVAQVASQKRRMLLNDVPPDYLPIASGLGSAPPACVVILPVLYQDRVLGVLELASFNPFSDIHLAFFDQFMHTMGVALHTIRANTELSEKAALLAAPSEYKTQFLANMSHELRTPLNSLLVLAQLLADNEAGNLSAEEVRFAQTIQRSGADLLQLINDVLDLSTVEAGRMEVRPQRLALLKLLTYVHDTFRPLALDRGIGFTVHVADSAPHELHSDERRIQQILRNLLSNAFKFTGEGRVELRVAPVTENGREFLTFTVSDTGMGIAEGRIARIFEAFQQGDSSTHRTYGGTGLGLSISQEIAGLLGGRITVESTVGEGSHFTLTVPTASAEEQPTGLDVPGRTDPGGRVLRQAMPQDLPQQAVPQQALPQQALPHRRFGHVGQTRRHQRPHRDHGAGAAPRSPLSPDAAPGTAVASGGPTAQQPLKDLTDAAGAAAAPVSSLAPWQRGRAAEIFPGLCVLVVDDDIRNVFALTHVLGRVGMSVRYAENGREALAGLREDPAVDLVLMDIMMPELDGYETIRSLRADSRFAELPVIALTAQAMPGDDQQSLTSGASAYVPKPVDIDLLLSTVLALLDPHSPTRPQ